MKYDQKIVTAFFKDCRLPEPVYELQYIPKRRFRLDIAWPAYKIGIEVQGGIHPFPRKRKDGTTVLMPGAHGTTAGIRRDNEKSNLGLLEGWAVIRVEPKELCMSDTAGMVRRLIEMRKEGDEL